MPTLNWIGKEAVVNHHLTVPFRLLKDVPELSCGDPGSGNLIVEGDNLVALKALLPYYAGQVKCIYIDPPYNTGNEGWAYNDNVNSPLIREWIGKAVGKEGETLDRHDRWLCMMYPRLALLKEFLREDGVIFVSIDENEFRFLELMMDEIFGISNRIETLIWKKSYGGGSKSKHIVNLHEYICCFAKNKEHLGNLDLPPDEGVLKYYKFRDSKEHVRGPYRLQPLATNSMDERPNLRFPISFSGHEIWPEKQWQWSQDRVTKALQEDELVIKQVKGKWSVNYKQYLKGEDGEERKSKLYSIIEGIYTQQGTNEIAAILGNGKAFDFPKPSRLVSKLIELCTEPGDTILDSFAGSGTTANAVLSLNNSSLDREPRKFITVELDARIASSITTKRIQNVIHGFSDRKNKSVPGLGGGFRYCQLGEPLFDESGEIRKSVSFTDLARHVWFTETGEPLPKERVRRNPLLGDYRGTGIYLLYNGILADKSPEGGNVLTRSILADLPPFDGPRVIYCAGCRIGADRLRREGITIRQTPYEIKVS